MSLFLNWGSHCLEHRRECDLAPRFVPSSKSWLPHCHGRKEAEAESPLVTVMVGRVPGLAWLSPG